MREIGRLLALEFEELPDPVGERVDRAPHVLYFGRPGWGDPGVEIAAAEPPRHVVEVLDGAHQGAPEAVREEEG